MNSNQAFALSQPGYDPYAAHSDTSGMFSDLGRRIKRLAMPRDTGAFYDSLVKKAMAKSGKKLSQAQQNAILDKFHHASPFSGAKVLVKPVKAVVARALPIVHTVLKNVGPIGMVASGALGAMEAGLSGKNLESIAWAAAEGAAPSGIDKAIGAAESLRHGSNVLKTAVNAGITHFIPGTPEHLGFDTAISTLKNAGSKTALGVARRALPTEGAKRAFDSAIGTVSQVVAANPQALLKRAGAIPSFSLSKAKGVISPYQPNLKHAMETLRRNPALMVNHPMVLAKQFGTTQQTVLDAIKRVQTTHLLPWRSLTPTAARFVKKWHPSAPISALTHGTSDTAGLTADGKQYVVVKGDSPWSIALKLSGNGANWTQLKALNADKKPTIDKNIWSGEVLNIPASWQKPSANPAPTPVASQTQPLPVQPSGPVTPAALPEISVAPGILQAKAILVAWGKTDGVNQAGVSDYGQNVQDLSTSMGPRDTLQLQAFQNWDNKTGNAGLAVTGQLDAASLQALQGWAETRAQQALPSASIPGQVVLPPMIVTAPPGSDPISTTPALPPVASPSKPATPETVAAANPGGTKMAPALAGAAIGGVLFGLPGALIGGVAGAAIA